MGELAARPAGEGRGRAGVTGDAVAAVGRDVAGKDAVPSAPVVPWLVNEPLWQESQRLALTAVAGTPIV